MTPTDPTEAPETLKQHALRLITEMQECDGGMCTHCIEVLCNELQPLLEIAIVEIPVRADLTCRPTSTR